MVSKIWLLVRVYVQSHYATEVLGAYQAYEDAEEARKRLEDAEAENLVETDDDDIEFYEDDDDDKDNHCYDIFEVPYHSAPVKIVRIQLNSDSVKK